LKWPIYFISILIEDIKLRDRWDDILAESKLVADGCGIDESFKMTNTKRRRKRLLPDKTAVEDDFRHDDPRDHFKRTKVKFE